FYFKSLCVYLQVLLVLNYCLFIFLAIPLYYCLRNCGRYYSRKNSMTRHMKFECGVPKQFCCPYCKKMFHRKSILKIHVMAVHKMQFDEILTISCKMSFHCLRNCGKSYNRKYSMQRHMKYECGVPKQFVCPYCNKNFSHKSNMKCHVVVLHNIHKLLFISGNIISASDRYYCPRGCGRNYKRKEDCVRHMKLECGIQPKFKCQFCNKRSHRKSNLKVHVVSVHKVPFEETQIIILSNS
ncbi:zinc finger protein 761-like, partial [Daktulosphaira vitifoliae]|uniref:zinc finger protein 761-like n=1 Tax=Daktulosphaira vitifoliae TaxID=58002 RepID=UPI0021A9E082